MKRNRIPFALPPLLAAAIAATLAPAPRAQDRHQWIVPSRSVLAPHGATPVRIAAAHAHVRILDRTASTTLEIELRNPSPSQQEAVLLLPVPDGAAVSNFTFEGPGAESSTRVLGRDEARTLYDQITSRLRDPALLEFAGWRCVRSSVFPVPGNGHQRIRLTYDHVLEIDGARADYVLPRSEALSVDVPWSITVAIAAASPIGAVYSPSHDIVTTRKNAREFAVQVAERSRRDPGSFRLSFVTTADPSRPTASLFAYPDPKVGGGYFLLIAAAPSTRGGPAMRREVTLVLDRSGSMAGRKLDQAKAAALQIAEALSDGEGIQLIDYGNAVSSAFAAPVAKDARSLAALRVHLDGIRPHGGTNIHDALLEALRAPTLPGTLPMVLFLTDGLPTVGPTRETDLRALVEKGNPHGRRVFCFGVGHDVNVPLLDRIADSTRATTTYVLPEEDVEQKVARTFARLDHPVLAKPKLVTVEDDATPGARIHEVLPARLPDVFGGDQLVVLGQYRGDDDLRFELSGTAVDGAKRYAFTLPVRTATTRHAFVPRLWASRQIAFLVDELRQKAGDLGVPAVSLASATADTFRDPRHRELRDEILRLSTQFGVLSEYTAFLATEGSDLGNWNALVAACGGELGSKAVATRTGIGAVNQGFNLNAQKMQTFANVRNVYLDSNLNTIATANVQQLVDCAFYKRGERWIDGRSVLGKRLEPDETIRFASPRYFELARVLEAEGRCAVLSLPGEVLVEVGGKNLLVIPATPEPRIEAQEIVR